MNRGPLKFRQADVTRAVKAARSAGLSVGKVEVAPDGTIRVIMADAVEAPHVSPFDTWKAKHASAA